MTDEVEPGVERIIRDDAGHDLDETHPAKRYDMDGIFVTADGTVWLQTTYNGSDNEGKPPGRLLWALGQPGVATVPEERCRTASTTTRNGETVSMGVSCVDESGERTTYLADTPINQVALAPDGGTVWAVGGYDGGNGGLYRITLD